MMGDTLRMRYACYGGVVYTWLEVADEVISIIDRMSKNEVLYRIVSVSHAYQGGEWHILVVGECEAHDA
jgi:hypothetical protein